MAVDAFGQDILPGDSVAVHKARKMLLTIVKEVIPDREFPVRLNVVTTRPTFRRNGWEQNALITPKFANARLQSSLVIKVPHDAFINAALQFEPSWRSIPRTDIRYDALLNMQRELFVYIRNNHTVANLKIPKEFVPI